MRYNPDYKYLPLAWANIKVSLINGVMIGLILAVIVLPAIK